ncbi:methyltransferase domain-containing protein [Streptomyces flaveolus]|uniref:class I SAM-dependent methyltransferase n=1 Tax=Streptomyces TaxID=1883 RepID=UPI00069F5911|nr:MULTISPECIES: class I SAM-dependent methyltransferase [Streptomyces]KOG72860.1 methyltransferase [Streptomyces antibioticus]MBG7701842.1 methyltransferase domain-containing protein [Streptomyces sp. MC1]
MTDTRAFYDTIAEDYADHFRDPLAERPLERALLSAYAEQVGPHGTVADLGCGPGDVTAHLAGLGLSVFGLDLSDAMIAIARRRHPALRFEQGSMRKLSVADGSLAGVVSWYSSIHTPVDELPDLFTEFHRVLAPGGRLLLAFQVGDVPLRLERPFGHDVALDYHRRHPEQMAELLSDAGFTLRSTTVRGPEVTRGESPVPQAFLLAQKEG